MNKLKKESMEHTFVLFLIMTIIGALALAWVLPSAKVMFSTPVELNTLDFESDLDGIYVKTTLSDLYGSYYKHTVKSSYSHMHVMQINDNCYIGVKVSNADVEYDNRFLEINNHLLEDIDDGAKLSEHQYVISGTIHKMTSAEQDRYYKYVDSGALPVKDHQYFLPYCLNVSDYGGNHNSTSIYLFGFVGILLLVAGLYALIAALCGHYQKPIKRYIRNSGSPEGTKQNVERFLSTAPLLHHLQYNERFLCHHSNGIVTFFNETNKLIWAYKVSERPKTTKLNNKLVLHDHAILLFFTDGIVHQCQFTNEQQADEVISVLEQLCPKAIIGYSLELEELLDRDLNAFLKMTYYSISDF